jgi:hypothetical protein
MVAHGALKRANGADVPLTSTVLFTASMPITAKLPARPSTVTVSFCLGTRVSRFAMSNMMQVLTAGMMVNRGHTQLHTLSRFSQSSILMSKFAQIHVQLGNTIPSLNTLFAVGACHGPERKTNRGIRARKSKRRPDLCATEEWKSRLGRSRPSPVHL